MIDTHTIAAAAFLFSSEIIAITLCVVTNVSRGAPVSLACFVKYSHSTLSSSWLVLFIEVSSSPLSHRGFFSSTAAWSSTRGLKRQLKHHIDVLDSAFSVDCSGHHIRAGSCWAAGRHWFELLCDRIVFFFAAFKVETNERLSAVDRLPNVSNCLRTFARRY